MIKTTYLDSIVSRETLKKIHKYCDFLIKYNKNLNLISKSTEEIIMSRHIEDSAQLLKYIDDDDKNILDIGSGAGFPGIVMYLLKNDIKILKKDVQKIAGSEIFINIHEIKKPNADGSIISQTIAQQLEHRVSFRKAMKTAIQNCFKQGAKGIKISCSGRLGGTEIARTEWYMEGRVPLHTLRANIDYGTAEANTTYGVIGIKTWVYKGDFAQKNRR